MEKSSSFFAAHFLIHKILFYNRFLFKIYPCKNQKDE